MLCQGPSSNWLNQNFQEWSVDFFLMLPNDTNIQLELLTVGLREPALVQFYVGRKKKKRENKSFKEKNGIKISNTFIG